MIFPDVDDLDKALSTVWAGKTTIPTNHDVLESTDVTLTTIVCNKNQQDVLLFYTEVQFSNPCYVFCRWWSFFNCWNIYRVFASPFIVKAPLIEIQVTIFWFSFLRLQRVFVLLTCCTICVPSVWRVTLFDCIRDGLVACNVTIVLCSCFASRGVFLRGFTLRASPVFRGKIT